MAIGEIFRTLGAAAGGAAQGYAGALGQVMQQRQQRDMYEGERADLASYRSAQLAQGERGLDLEAERMERQAEEGAYSRSLDRRRGVIDKMNAKTARMREETARMRLAWDEYRAMQPTRKDEASKERQDARYRRAEKVMSEIMSQPPGTPPSVLDDIARRGMFRGGRAEVDAILNFEQYQPPPEPDLMSRVLEMQYGPGSTALPGMAPMMPPAGSDATGWPGATGGRAPANETLRMFEELLRQERGRGR